MANPGVQVISSAPDAAVVFYPYREEDTTSLSQSQATQAQEIVATREVISIATTKAKKQAGTFTITLGPKTPWIDKLHPGAWCFIYLKNEKITGVEQAELDSGLKMIGFVRSIRAAEGYDPGTGRRQVRYIVSGDDFQGMLNFPVYLFTKLAEFGGASGGSAFFQQYNTAGVVLADQSAASAVNLILKALIGGTSLRADGTGSIFKISGAVATQSSNRALVVPQEVHRRIWGESVKNSNSLYLGMMIQLLQSNLAGRIFQVQALGGQVSPWSTLQAYTNPILNELYTELIPVRTGGSYRLAPALILRAIPFSSKQGSPHKSCIAFTSASNQQIATVNRKTKTTATGIRLQNDTAAHFYISKVISETEIYSMHMGRSDQERFNIFAVPSMIDLPRIQQVGLTQIVDAFASSRRKELVDDLNISRYGSRPYIAQTNYQFAGPGLTFSKIARDLWGKAYLYQSGVVRMHGSSDYIPVGTNVKFAERPILAHVEQVDHSYNVLANGTKLFETTLYLTRAQQPNGKQLKVSENNPDGSKASFMAASSVTTDNGDTK